MGRAAVQGQLWGALARDWAPYGEQLCLPLQGAALDAAHVTAGTRLLDAGCGAGLLALLASLRGRSRRGRPADPLVCAADRHRRTEVRRGGSRERRGLHDGAHRRCRHDRAGCKGSIAGQHGEVAHAWSEPSAARIERLTRLDGSACFAILDTADCPYAMLRRHRRWPPCAQSTTRRERPDEMRRSDLERTMTEYLVSAPVVRAAKRKP